MSFEMPNFLPAVPEMFLLGMVCLLLIIDLFLSERTRVVTYLLAQATLAVTFLLTVWLYGEPATTTFNGTFVHDTMGSVLKLFIYAAVFMVFLYSRHYLEERNMFRGEFYILALFAVLGMMVMVSSGHMLTLYLGLELLSLSMYAMVAMQRESIFASEAAMKYFVLGAMASAMLLYGISMLYGATGTLSLAEMDDRIVAGAGGSVILTFGLVFLIVGIAFKLGAVPFHMWVPDVYHGSPTAVTIFISTAPKLAAFAMMMRLLVDGLPGMQVEWRDMLIILSVLSMGIGNLVAIAQTNLKRMLAYSGISHIGFILLGVLTGTQAGYSASMFYAIAYVIMGLGGFGMILLMSRGGFEAEELSDYKGLNERSPWFALMVLFLMFSMAGVPPFLGFWAKLEVLSVVVDANLIWLALAAVLFSVIGAFFYLRVIKLCYFDRPETDQPLTLRPDLVTTFGANAIAILLLGLLPGGLMAICQAAIAG